MSLKRATNSLPQDRETQMAIQECLLALQRHEGEWLEVGRVAVASGVPEPLSRTILRELVRASVLTVEGETPRYRYAPDRLLALEVGSFLRRSEARTGKLQDNVARFRERYGGR